MVYCRYGVATAQCGPILTIFADTTILHTIQVPLLPITCASEDIDIFLTDFDIR